MSIQLSNICMNFSSKSRGRLHFWVLLWLFTGAPTTMAQVGGFEPAYDPNTMPGPCDGFPGTAPVYVYSFDTGGGGVFAGCWEPSNGIVVPPYDPPTG
jgi:hypothetical protein